ncbi:RNA/RNP complex-1-interacting phosphatase-like isoform X2 [Micropterus salmoides]|uniref:RNA/RNP complex-1-interacting phosphatase-like isoform X2 n=1 Tax=Micropterus salmoides TaxID=27706 RepID=UPI0018EC060B|nr:RNA/RNP complex-1-interacting phosphatase-like isoform X2 [Micropterus salmoides]
MLTANRPLKRWEQKHQRTAEMPHYNKKKNGVPDRWLDYRPVGQRIPGTRFIAFKVPLKPSLNRQVSESDSFGLWDLLDSVESQNQELGLIIDLTFTTRYYSLADVPQSCSYIKILTEGRRVPSGAAILSFKRAVRCFLRENRDNDKLIGVHCTHGLNRTGYLVCRYLIDVDGLDPAAALEMFNSCRGHRIERQNYLDDLQRGAKRSNNGIDKPEEVPARGLAVERPARGLAVERQAPPARGLGVEPPARGLAVERQAPPARGLAVEPPARGLAVEPPATSAAGEERRPADDDPAEETQPVGDKRPRGNRHRRGARHRRRAGQKDGVLLPPPPLPSYVWSPAYHPPPSVQLQ